MWTKGRFYWSWEKLRKNVDSGYANTGAESKLEIGTNEFVHMIVVMYLSVFLQNPSL